MASSTPDPPPGAPFFAAYVYPGWHPSSFRPGVDEWTLLDDFAPYFEGHAPPLRPIDGPYNDADPATARRHLALAQSYGVGAFTYFLYYRPDEFVLADPVRAIFAEADNAVSPVQISLTWCIRLPHQSFPIEVTDDPLEQTENRSPSIDFGKDRGNNANSSLIQDLTLDELQQILDR